MRGGSDARVSTRRRNAGGAPVQRALHSSVRRQRAPVCAVRGSLSRAADLVRRVPGLTLTLDYTHFTRVGIPDAEIEPLIAYASHFHIRGARPGRLQTRFADNTIDYRRVVEVARAHNYQGWLGLEYVWQDWEHCNECDNVSETILFRDFLRAQV